MNPKRWRKMTWAIVIFSILMLIWVIGAIASRPSKNCPPHDQLCINASDAGTGIGVSLLFVLWFIGFIVLSIIWFMTRPKNRTCPQCGHDVKVGLMRCGHCGYDFTVQPQIVNQATAGTGDDQGPAP